MTIGQASLRVRQVFFSAPNLILGGVLAILLFFYSVPAQAGVFEISLGFSYSQSNYGDANFEWTRRWSASLGYYFFSASEVEISFQDAFHRTCISGFQDTAFHDQIYSLDWVQALSGRSAVFQPYFRMGIGQLNRDAVGVYPGGASPPASLDALTGVAGFGLKINFHQSFSLKIEGTTYFAGMVLSTWKDNFAVHSGLSIFF